MPIQPARLYFAIRRRRAGSFRPLKKIGGCGFWTGFAPKPAQVEVGELAVVLEELVGPDALHDLDGLPHMGVPSREDVRRARGGELLGHPAGAHAHVDPPVREMVTVAISAASTPGAR